MLPSTLSKNIDQIAQELQIKKVRELEKFLEVYFKSKSRFKYLYVGALMRKVSINQEQAYLLLNKLVKDDYLTRLYEFRCPIDGCTNFLKTDYMNLPDSIICPECHEEFITREHLFMVYEVNNE